MGARFLTAESGDNWGPNGLGYYVAARLLWDIRESDRVDETVNDFLDKSFGAARAPMAKFYELIDGGKKPFITGGFVRQMYAFLAEAENLNHDPKVQTRIDDLILYTRYVELFQDYRNSILGRQAGFDRVLMHSYRMRKTMMVHTKAIFRDGVYRSRLLTVPPDWNTLESTSSWKNNTPFSRQELDAMLRGSQN